MAEMKSQPSGCQIPYPDRYKLAAEYATRLPESAVSNEAKLLLYALKQQADHGPCKEPKPWGWNVVESAKWQSWSQLGNMSQLEAMRLYVKTLDETRPDWWTRLSAGGAGGKAGGGLGPGAAACEGGEVCISSAFKEGTWVVIQQDDSKKPLPRYEQGAAMLGSLLYVIGGHYGGRYLQDLWVYDLNKLQWGAATPAAAAPAAEGDSSSTEPADTAAAAAEAAAPLLDSASMMPAAAGHSVTPWNGRLLVLGGHIKVKQPGSDLAVRLLDPSTMTWGLMSTTGKAPCSRGGHTACMVGDLLYVYGGEDVHRRPLSDVWALHLGEMHWQQVEVKGGPKVPAPAPRSGHAATVYKDKHLVVFGGGSIANCYNDTWVLDLERRTWTRPSVFGKLPPPRAGHSAALVGDTWYVLGGGNNIKGCVDMLAADLSDITIENVTWRRVCTVPAGSPLSSEGVSLMHVPHLQLLVAFGGYNGKYHNTVSVYKLPLESDEHRTEGAATAAPPAPANGQPAAKVNPGSEARAGSPAKGPAAAAAAQNGSGAEAGAGQQQQPAGQQQQASALEQQLAAAEAAAGVSNNNGGLPHSGSSGMLKELAMAREQLKRDLKSSQAEVAELKAAAATAAEAAAAENGLLRRQLAAAEASLTDSEKALDEARHALSAEQSQVLKLEAQLAEASERLQKVDELERALERYNKMEAESAAAAKKGSSGGLWGFIAGGSQ